MRIIEVTSLDAPELDAYARLTEAQLRNRLEPEKGIFIAESPKVIGRALDAGMQPLSMLMDRSHLGNAPASWRVAEISPSTRALPTFSRGLRVSG